MDIFDSDTLFEKAVCIVKNAGCILLEHSLASRISQKGKTDFVTAVDVKVQDEIKKELYKLNSQIQFMGEEQDNTDIDTKRPVWILDKTTPRLIQFHTLKNAVNPPFLGGFLIFGTVVA